MQQWESLLKTKPNQHNKITLTKILSLPVTRLLTILLNTEQLIPRVQPHFLHDIKRSSTLMAIHKKKQNLELSKAQCSSSLLSL